MNKITAPFDEEQVIQLNSWQMRGAFHPFTCAKPHGVGVHVSLVATADGWVCPDPECTYTQNWAHPYMAVWWSPTPQPWG